MILFGIYKINITFAEIKLTMENNSEQKGCAWMIFAFFAGLALIIWASKS